MKQADIKGHWNMFIKCIDHQNSQGPTGTEPSKLLSSLDGVALPSTKLSRVDVREICRDENQSVLFGYVCAMAWGGQQRNHFESSWKQRKPLADILSKLRKENLTRGDAYRLFLENKADKEKNIGGLGPAFWTKLLFFFGPADAGLPYTPESKNCYIMDQWTAKSINLLTGLHLVKIEGTYVTPDNKCGNYQAFCEEIDQMAKILSEKRGENVTGEKVEEWLFSKGGHNKWPWREYVDGHYPYDPEPLRKKYPHINDF